MMKQITSIDDLFQVCEKVAKKDQDLERTNTPPLQTVEDQQKHTDGEESLSVEEMLKKITFEDYFESVDASVRLQNSILAEITEGQFPYANLADYYYGSQDHKDLINKVRSFGKKSRNELDDGLDDLVKDEDRLRMIASPVTDAHQDINLDPVSAAFFQITLHDFAEIAPLMVRTKNSIAANLEKVEMYFPTVGDYYSAPEPQKRGLLKIPNFGKGSKKDLDKAIENFVSDRDRLAFFVNHAGQHGIDIGGIPASEQYEPQASLLLGVGERVRQILTIQELNVLKLRLVEGLFLENIGKLYDVTRERIRQIEASALNKLRMTLMPEVTVFKKRITEILSETKGIAEYKKTLDEWPEIDAVSFAILLDLLNEKDEGDITLKKGVLWREDRYQIKKEIYRRIDNEFLSNHWPVGIPSLALRLPEIPLFLIERRLKSRYKVSIDNEVIHSANKLTTGQQARFALRSLGGPSHHSVVYKKMCEMFDNQVTPHAVEADLGRSKDIVIVALGTYALYDSLWLDEEDIQQIRGDVFHYLSEKREYVRSPHIFDTLFKGRKFSGREINPYIVLGVVQDDDQNFRTKPGLLIGLSHFGDTYQITDVIRDIVREHGPIHIDKIAKLLPKGRRIGKEAISTILLSDDNLVRQKYGTYDTVERVLGSKEEMNSLLTDIRYLLQSRELESDVIFEHLVKNRHPKLTENALRVLLRRHFKKNKETGFFYAD